MIKKILSFFVVAVAVFASADGLTNLQKNFVRQRVRVVRRDTQAVPGHVVNYFQQGSRTWCTTNALTVISQTAVLQLSKLDLIATLKSIDKWTATKAFIIESDLYDEWLACRWISTDYPAFIAATNSAVKAGLATDQEIKRVIEASIDR